MTAIFMGEYKDFLEGELLKSIYKITQQNINFSSGSGGGGMHMAIIFSVACRIPAPLVLFQHP